jgi:uncharacterized repeat protein (TIGR03809 family)
MTHRQEAAWGRELVSRWCNLAERRLEHLTEMYETGRWQLYHSERAFLENIREAKAAVETWRDLLTREASRNNYALDLSWLGRGTSGLSLDQEQPREPAPHPLRSLEPWPVAAEPPPSAPAKSAEVIWLAPQGAPEEMTTAPVIDLVAFERELMSIFRAEPEPEPEPAPQQAAEIVLDFAAIQARYPLLRNAL